jgi:hypothetical protein
MQSLLPTKYNIWLMCGQCVAAWQLPIGLE